MNLSSRSPLFIREIICSTRSPAPLYREEGDGAVAVFPAGDAVPFIVGKPGAVFAVLGDLRSVGPGHCRQRRAERWRCQRCRFVP